LGWALHLLAVTEGTKHEDLEHCKDIIRLHIEPIPSEDCRTEALYVAPFLAIIDEAGRPPMASTCRAAFLSLWFESHNASVTADKLLFWLEEDLDTYCLFVEDVFATIHDHTSELALISPLASLWKQSSLGEAILKFLKRWLLLSYRGDATGGVLAYSETLTLPLCKEERQLRLSSAALSIISQRPDPIILPALATAYATTDASSIGIEEKKHYFKYIDRNVSYLMRWCYTDTILPELERLALSAVEPKELEGLQLLASLLELDNLPPVLSREWDRRDWPVWDPLEKLKAGEVLFPEDARDILEFHVEMSHLAVRRDLPAPRAQDQERMRDALKLILEEKKPHCYLANQSENNAFDSFAASTARHFPQHYSGLMAKAAAKAFSYENPEFLHLRHLVPSIFTWNSNSEAAYLAAAKKHLELAAAGQKASGPNPPEFGTAPFSEIIFLNCSDERIVDWLIFLSQLSGDFRRRFYSGALPDLIHILKPAHLCETAKLAAKHILAEATEGNTEDTRGRLTFWVYLWALTTEEDREAYQWARDLILSCTVPQEDFFAVFSLFWAAMPTSVWQDVLLDRELVARLQLFQERRLFLATQYRPIPPTSALSYEQLLSTLSWGATGCMLHSAGREKELERWGFEFLELLVASSATNQDAKSRFSEIEFQYLLDAKNSTCGKRQTTTSVTTLGRSTNLWGVPYGSMAELKDLSQEEQYSERRKRSHAFWTSFDELKKNRGLYFFEFYSFEALKAWATNHKEAFIDFAERYLSCQAAFEDCFLGLATDSMLRILVHYKPEQAFSQWTQWQRNVFRTSVRDHAGSFCFAGEAWDGSCSSVPGIKAVRGGLFHWCQDDEQIAYMALAAIGRSNSKELFSWVADGPLAGASAVERNLAVSILPWIADKESLRVVKLLSVDDPSHWVRRSAAWAAETIHQDQECRQIYREALLEKDASAVSAALHVLRPALLPAAEWWHHQTETELEFWQRCSDPRTKALLCSFWHHWKWDGMACGRKLREYHRGEKLDAFVCKRLYPWWILDS
jgi:hypothetical protein